MCTFHMFITIQNKRSQHQITLHHVHTLIVKVNALLRYKLSESRKQQIYHKRYPYSQEDRTMYDM